jgi:hypothetical protein
MALHFLHFPQLPSTPQRRSALECRFLEPNDAFQPLPRIFVPCNADSSW